MVTMLTRTNTHLGTVVELNPIGLAVVFDRHCVDLRAFTLDKIAGYKGESPQELTRFSPRGLQEGLEVRYSLDDKGRINGVYPLNENAN